MILHAARRLVKKIEGYSSSIIFDYIFKSALDGTSNDTDEKKWRKSAQKNWEQGNESITYGISGGAVENFSVFFECAFLAQGILGNRKDLHRG